MIKGAKECLSNKDYLNLMIVMGVGHSDEKRNDQTFYDKQPHSKRAEKEDEKSQD